MSGWLRGLVIAAVTLGLVACGDADGGGGQDDSTVQSTSTTAANPGGTSTALTALDTFTRSIPPDDVDGTSSTLVVVPEGLASVWESWGPTASNAPPMPSVPAGAQVVVVWHAGSGLVVDGYRITDGRFVIVGERSRPAEGCISPQAVEGTTLVFTTDDPEVTPGMPIGDAELTDVEVPC